MFKPHKMRVLSRDLIYVDPEMNARRTMYKRPIEEMRASIDELGLLHPVGVRVIDKPGLPPYQLVYGYRRVRALDEIGADQVPVVVVDADEARAYDMMLAENIIRQDVLPWDLGGSVLLLLKQGLTYPDIAERLSLALDKSLTMSRLQRLAQTLVGLSPQLLEVWKRGSAEFQEDDAYRASQLDSDAQFDLYVKLVGGVDDKPFAIPSGTPDKDKPRGKGRPRQRSIELAYQSIKNHEDDEHDDGLSNHDQRKGAKLALQWVLGARSKCPIKMRPKKKAPQKKDETEE